jgi:FKBP-type peptidyl-prolyl cis-trans isomerase SlpA
MPPRTPQIRPGSRIGLHIAISLADGTEALSTFEDAPVHCTLGDGTLDAGLERLLLGLRAGDELTERLDPGQAYGLPDGDKIHWLPREDFPPGMELAPNLIVAFTSPGGQELAGTILELEGDRAKVDFNHPLAGHAVICRVQILSVEP